MWGVAEIYSEECWKEGMLFTIGQFVTSSAVIHPRIIMHKVFAMFSRYKVYHALFSISAVDTTPLMATLLKIIHLFWLWTSHTKQPMSMQYGYSIISHHVSVSVCVCART